MLKNFEVFESYQLSGYTQYPINGENLALAYHQAFSGAYLLEEKVDRNVTFRLVAAMLKHLNAPECSTIYYGKNGETVFSRFIRLSAPESNIAFLVALKDVYSKSTAHVVSSHVAWVLGDQHKDNTSAGDYILQSDCQWPSALSCYFNIPAGTRDRDTIAYHLIFGDAYGAKVNIAKTIHVPDIDEIISFLHTAALDIDGTNRIRNLAFENIAARIIDDM